VSVFFDDTTQVAAEPEAGLGRAGGVSVASRQPSGGVHRGGRVPRTAEIAVELVRDNRELEVLRAVYAQLALIPDRGSLTLEQRARIAYARTLAYDELNRNAECEAA
jgi:hypothetical protein